VGVGGGGGGGGLCECKSVSCAYKRTASP